MSGFCALGGLGSWRVTDVGWTALSDSKATSATSALGAEGARRRLTPATYDCVRDDGYNNVGTWIGRREGRWPLTDEPRARNRDLTPRPVDSRGQALHLAEQPGGDGLGGCPSDFEPRAVKVTAPAT